MATLLIPSILLMGVQKVYAATGSLLMNDFQVSTGSAINVPVRVNITGGDLSEFSITVTYDESVVDILTDTDIVLNPLFTGTVVASSGPGISTITASTLTPQTGTIELADLGFTAIGASGASATVTVTPEGGSFVDSTTAPFSPEPAPVSATATLVDTTPDVFSFPAQNNVPLSTPIDSAPITVTGIDVVTPISINNGAEYSIDNGAFTSVAGTINNNQTVVVRLLSSASYSTTTTTFLKVGLGGDDFRVTTLADPSIDTVPDGFAFVNQFNVPLSTPIDSAPITIAGINAPSPITVTNGEYSINSGAFTSTAGTIENGSTVVVRLISSADYLTATSAVLNVGGAADDFRVTTLALPDTTPDQFTFVDQIDMAPNAAVDSNAIVVSGINLASPITITGGEYSINGGVFTSVDGTVNNNDSVVVRQTTSASFSSTTDASLTIGGVNDIFSVTTIAQDVTPDQFTFIDQTDVAPSTPIDSNAIIVAGINSAAPITILNGEYSINGAAFTSADGTVNVGDSIIVRQTSSSAFATPTTATLTIGGVSDDFTVTTFAEDTTPDQFTFVDQTDVTLSTAVDSNAITVAGINSPALISIVGGEYSINGGAFTSGNGIVNNGESVIVRQTSSASFNTTTDATLTIGGVSDTFSVITIGEPGDTTPNPFTFTDQTDVAISTPIVSDAITVSGITAAAPISITAGEYSINNGAFISTDSTINNGDTVIVRQTSSSSFATPTTATLTIGGVSDGFTVTTAAEDTTPAPFTLSAITQAPLNTIETSNTITVAGINSPSPATITGGEYSINGGPYTTDPALVSNADQIVVRLTSSPSPATTSTATLTIGGVSASFNVTTVDEDSTPDQFTFNDQTDVPLSTVTDSDPINIMGINVSVPISIVGGEYSINGEAFTAADGTIGNGNSVIVRQTSSASFATTTTATLTVGGISDAFSITTIAETNGAPVLGTISDQNVLINNALTFTATASDPNGNTLTFSLANAPAGAVIDPATGVFTWTPSQIGAFTFDVIVSDGNLSDTDSITINVSETPQPPIVAPTVKAEDNGDGCGRDCKKYNEYRRKFKSNENHKIYLTLKAMKNNDPANFMRLENTYKLYKDFSDREIKKLSLQVQNDFKQFKKYEGYKHYKNYKEKVGK